MIGVVSVRSRTFGITKHDRDRPVFAMILSGVRCSLGLAPRDDRAAADRRCGVAPQLAP